MAFEWQNLLTNLAPPLGSEQWNFISLPPAPGLVRYGYRLVVAANTPQSWNTGGFFTLGQVVADQATISRTQPIPLVGRGVGQAIQVLGSGDFEIVSEGSQALFLVYMVHRWVEADTMQIWGLIDV